MRILITMLFFALASSVCWANDANPFYHELSPLGLLVMILIPLVIFLGLVATLLLSMVYSFGEKFEGFKLEKFKPVEGGVGWQIWLLVIFALAAVIISVLLFSPAIIIVVLIILAITGAFIFLINRG